MHKIIVWKNNSVTNARIRVFQTTCFIEFLSGGIYIFASIRVLSNHKLHIIFKRGIWKFASIRVFSKRRAVYQYNSQTLFLRHFLDLYFWDGLKSSKGCLDNLYFYHFNCAYNNLLHSYFLMFKGFCKWL